MRMINSSTLIIVVSIAIGVLLAIELRVHGAQFNKTLSGCGLGLCLGIVLGLVTIDILETIRHDDEREAKIGKADKTVSPLNDSLD